MLANESLAPEGRPKAPRSHQVPGGRGRRLGHVDPRGPSEKFSRYVWDEGLGYYLDPGPETPAPENFSEPANEKSDYHKPQFSLNRWLTTKNGESALQFKRQSWACSDCGAVPHHAALDWDHLPGFEKDPRRLFDTRMSGADMLWEIQKCQPVCANCHRVRTYERRQDPESHDGAERPDLIDWVRNGVPA